MGNKQKKKTTTRNMWKENLEAYLWMKKSRRSLDKSNHGNSTFSSSKVIISLKMVSTVGTVF